MPAVGVISRIITHPHNGATVAGTGAEHSGATGGHHAAPRPTSHHLNQQHQQQQQPRLNGGGGRRNSNAGIASAWQQEPTAGGATTTFQNNIINNNNNSVKHDNKFRQSYPHPADPQSQQMSAYRRWLAKNRRVGQSQPASSLHLARQAAAAATAKVSVNSKLLRDARNSVPKYKESPGAAAILYLGIGMIAIGLVITIVGLGDDVFKTLALQLVGPTLVGLGVVVCAIRVLVCFCCADRCQLCDRPIEYAERGDRLKSASLKSWRPDSRSVVKEKPATTPSSSEGASTSTAKERRPPSGRVTLERGEQRVLNMAAVSGSAANGRPYFTSPTPSFQDFSTTSSSGSDTRPGTTRSSPDPSLALSSLHSDDIGNLLSEFKEIELQRVTTSRQHRVDVVADPAAFDPDAYELPEFEVPEDDPPGNSEVPLEAAAKIHVPPVEVSSSASGSARERPRASCRALCPPPVSPSPGLTSELVSSPEMTSPELEVQRFLQMELQKVFQFDLPAFKVSPNLRPTSQTEQEGSGGSAHGHHEAKPEVRRVPDAAIDRTSAQQRFMNSAMRGSDVTKPEIDLLRTETPMTHALRRQQTEVEEILRDTETEVDSRSPEVESRVEVVREEEVQRVLHSEQMEKILQEVKVSKIQPTSGNRTISRSPKTSSAHLTKTSSLRLATPASGGGGTRRDLNAGIVLNPTTLVRPNTDGQVEDRYGK